MKNNCMSNLQYFKRKFDEIIVQLDKAIDELNYREIRLKLYDLIDLSIKFLMELEEYRIF